MTDEKIVPNLDLKLAKAEVMAGQPPFGEIAGNFYMPYNQTLSKLGITPEKLVIPREYHEVIAMIYDFYERGGIVNTVINRLAELSLTDIRNGERETSDEANAYYEAVLHRRPSRLMRFLSTAFLEYFLSGLVIPNVTWETLQGKDVHPGLVPDKEYQFPVFDLYPPALMRIEWAGWGEKRFFLKVPTSDLKLIRRDAEAIKNQQLKVRLSMWESMYPGFVDQIRGGSDVIELTDVDPILRKEKSNSPYPTPYLFNALESLIFKQQLRRMDFAVASRVINAILLVQEGNDNYPITEETRDNLDQLKNQILARSANPRLMERLFILFSNHTTKLTWITPDVNALLDQNKYVETNVELQEALGFSQILLTGVARATGSAAEVSTWAIQPQMEQLRSMTIEWLNEVYDEAADQNGFSDSDSPVPKFKPIRLQDVVKTAAIFQQVFAEGNSSRTSRAESIGLDFETEVELMKDEVKLMKGMPQFPAMPYSAAPPITGQMPGKTPPGAGRPQGSSNVAVNNRNSGVKPRGQKPTQRVISKAELMDDEEVIALMDKIALDRGIIIGEEILEDGDGEV